jgi:hypothetical protein
MMVAPTLGGVEILLNQLQTSSLMARILAIAKPVAT